MLAIVGEHYSRCHCYVSGAWEFDILAFITLLLWLGYNVDTIRSVISMSTVAKWGNSLAIRIPKNIAEQINLEEGMAISINITNNNIIITPQKPQYTLEELLAGASSEHFDGEYDWGEPTGEEIW